MNNEYEVRGEIAVVFLDRKNGERLEAIIDIEDLETVKSFPNKWYASKNKMGTYYAVGDICKGSRKAGTFIKNTHLMHRWIKTPPVNKVVDHIDHDTLNNSKENLRVLSIGENNQNRKSKKIPGVYPYHHDNSKWVANITANGKRMHLGIFSEKREAEKVVLEHRESFFPFANKLTEAQ